MIKRKINLDIMAMESGPFGLCCAFRNQALREGWTAEEIQSVLNDAAIVENPEANIREFLAQYCIEFVDFQPAPEVIEQQQLTTWQKIRALFN